MDRRFWSVAAVVAMVALMPFAAVAQGVTLNIAVDTDAPTLDPQMHAERVANDMCFQIYDPLFRTDNAGNHIPALALSAKVINDTTVELILRQGVTFQNGEPFDAEVVKWNFERVNNPDNKSPQLGWFNWVQSTEVINKYTVRLHLTEPYPLWQSFLERMMIVPMKYTMEKGAAYLADHPIGTGPYKFVSWRRGSELVLEANPTHYRTAPKVSKVVFKVLTDASTRIAALLSGDVDLVTFVDPENMATLKQTKDIFVAQYPIVRFSWVCLADALNPASPLHDKRVRQAMNYAVDKESIINDVIGGLGNQTVVLNSMLWGCDPKVLPYPYDLTKAKQLMKEAGYANGFDITLNMTPVNQVKGEEVYQAVQAMMAKINIRMKIQKWSGVGYMDLVTTGKANPMYILNWGTQALDGDPILYPFFYSKGSYGNFWSSPETDRLIMQEHTSMDPKVRSAAMSKAQQIIREEAPWIFMFGFHQVDACRSSFIYNPRADGILEVYNIGINK